MKGAEILWFGILILAKLCQGVSIDIMEVDSSDCLHPPIQIICTTTSKELQDAGNRLTITHGGLTLATCGTDTGTCTSASTRYNVTIEGTRAVLTIYNMDVFYDSTTWSCDVGPKTASLKLKYFRAKNEHFSKQIVSLSVNLLTLIVALMILTLLIIHMCCKFCCNRASNKDNSKDEECCSCFGNCFAKKPEQKTGYTGKKYDVKTSYIIEDPNHVADAKFKDGVNRKSEAERACKNVSPTQKEKIAENLTEFVEVRKPLVSTTSDGTDNKA